MIKLQSAAGNNDIGIDFYRGTDLKWEIRNNGNDDSLFFIPQGQNDADTKLAIKSDGNVGIGTIAPVNKFHINDGTNINLGIAAASSAIKLNALNDAVTGNIPMEFGASVFGFVGGSVGIGTTSPEAALTVAGPNYTHAIFRTNQSTASQRAGGGFSSLGSSTAAKQICSYILGCRRS